jgi:L-amino acid N-acyltransferase YncA
MRPHLQQGLVAPVAHIERLISRTDPADAVAAYYAWCHAGSAVHIRRRGADVGVLVEAASELGALGLLRATSPVVVPDLIAAIRPGRRYLMAPWSLADAVRKTVKIDEPERNAVFWVDRDTFVSSGESLSAIRREGTSVVAMDDNAVVARCRPLWRSEGFAELAVSTDMAFRRRGLARQVMSAMIERLLAEGVTPLHVASDDNVASLRLAAGLGFQRCPADEFAGYLSLTPVVTAFHQNDHHHDQDDGHRAEEHAEDGEDDEELGEAHHGESSAGLGPGSVR